MITINQPQLTLEQIELIPVYRSKWQQVALNRKTIDREQARLVINNAYDFWELSQPNIIFFSRPIDALEYIYEEITNSRGKLENSSFKNPVAGQLIYKLIGNFDSQIQGAIYQQLESNLDNGLADRIAEEIGDRFPYNRIFSIIWAHASSLMLSSATNSKTDEITQAFFNIFLSMGFIFSHYLSSPLWEIQKQMSQFWGSSVEKNSFSQMSEILFTGKFPQNNNSNQYQLPQIQLSSNTVNVIVPSVVADYAYYIDYLHKVLSCSLDRDKWKIFEDLIVNCGWIFPYEKTVLVCGA